MYPFDFIEQMEKIVREEVKKMKRKKTERPSCFGAGVLDSLREIFYDSDDEAIIKCAVEIFEMVDMFYISRERR